MRRVVLVVGVSLCLFVVPSVYILVAQTRAATESAPVGEREAAVADLADVTV